MNKKMNNVIKGIEWTLDFVLRPVTFTNNLTSYIIGKKTVDSLLNETIHTVTYEDGKEVID